MEPIEPNTGALANRETGLPDAAGDGTVSRSKRLDNGRGLEGDSGGLQATLSVLDILDTGYDGLMVVRAGMLDGQM